MTKATSKTSTEALAKRDGEKLLIVIAVLQATYGDKECLPWPRNQKALLQLVRNLSPRFDHLEIDKWKTTVGHVGKNGNYGTFITEAGSVVNARFKRCTVLGCGNPTQAYAGKGLSPTYCTSHVRYLARHGSAHRPSYRASELRPYIWAAERWLKENKGNSFVRRIELAYEAMMNAAGPPEIATRMIRTKAKRKANNALARMRVRKVRPIRLMTIVLATHAALEDDQSYSHRGGEFRQVQIARQAHRLAARFVPRGYEAKVKDGIKWGFKNFPHSAGLVLRELGSQLDDLGGHLVDRALPRILELKVQRWGHHPSRQALAASRPSVNA